MDKETLQKKIESGDTVWGITQDDELIKFNASWLKHPTWFETGEPILDRLNLVYTNKDGNTDVFDVENDNVFATKEDAEFALEFGNVTRTEKLELPTWEQMQENIDWGIDGKNRTWFLLKTRGHDIIRVEDKNSNGIFEKPLTYANYLEACRLCKKLFLGEEL